LHFSLKLRTDSATGKHIGMALVTRGRLSVQRVTEASWGVISMLAEKGGWNEETVKRTGREEGEERKETTSPLDNRGG
jgi:hypothetical protein